jgi:hypothetical protein
MMQLRYDEDLVEAAVILCTRGRPQAAHPFVADATKSCTPHPVQIARFHREREKLYAILDPDDRNAAFFKLHLEWFREWGLEKLLIAPLQEFPLLASALHLLAFRQSRRRNDEGAELYINDAGQRTGVLALRVERFADAGSGRLKRAEAGQPRPESVQNDAERPEGLGKLASERDESRSPSTLQDFLRHEFTHLHDMVDPAFGYSPEVRASGPIEAQQRLTRERYRLLWDITIDGRLASAGRQPMAAREQHEGAFRRAYSFWPAGQQAQTFDALWRASAPRHDDLMQLAADPRGLRDAQRPMPGGACPLCQFPTFDWAPVEALPPEILKRITAEFPGWSAEQGLCGRCREAYEVVAKQAHAL